MTGGNHSISVWFLCKSCGFTFHFQHVDEFLEHKKQVHFSEFEKIRCIVFEEKIDYNQEYYPDQAREILDSLFSVDKVEVPEEDVEYFLEPEALPSASISTNNAMISQDSPAGSELSLQDPKLFSSYVLARRLTSLELQLTQGNEIGKLSTNCLQSIIPLQSVPTFLALQRDKDELHGNSASSPSQELSAVKDSSEISNPILPSVNESISNRTVSVSTDPTEENILESQNDTSSTSSNDIQLSSASGSENSALKHLSNSNISSDEDTDVFESGPFIFPSPESDSEDANDPLTLKDWLLHQVKTTDSNGTKNIILLDPDPTKQNIGPVTSENPITCRLCCKKLLSKPEVKVHVKHCWLLNKKRHRFCVTCAKSFSRPLGLKRHNRFIHGAQESKTFECQYCPDKFESKINRNRHEDTHPEKPEILKPFSCKFCNKPFRSKAELRQHLIGHSTDRPFKCDHPNCSFASKTAQDQKLHKIAHENNPNFKRLDVIFQFPYFQIPEHDIGSDDLALADWIAKQTEVVEGTSANVILLEPDPTKENVGPITQENYISCKLCCKKLTSESRVKIHAIHCWFQNKASHKYCVSCDKSYLHSSNLRKHSVRIHGTEEEKTELRRFKCQQCPKTYMELGHLQFHAETHKSKDEQNRPFVCETCGLRFFRSKGLRFHLQTHSDERSFKCLHPNCTEAFKTKASRHMHMKRHSDSRPHECQHLGCSKSFKTTQGLRVHSEVHEDKPYKCTHGNCRKKFSSTYKLQRHIKERHTEDGNGKNVECDVCHKKFARKYELNRHSAIHLNLEDKPFKCRHEGCKEAFNFKQMLEEHERKHTGEQPFVCDTCGKKYSKRWSFRSHVRAHMIVPTTSTPVTVARENPPNPGN